MPKDKNKIPLSPILSVNFIGTLGFSVVLPFLVFLVTKFGGDAMLYGILGAVYPFFQLIGGPVLGKWSDIYGRKKILLLSQAGTVLGWIIFFIAFYLPLKTVFSFNSSLTGNLIFTLPLLVLFLARAIDGITGGNISVANAYLSDITSEKDRSKNFGKLSISSNLGFILGPAMAGLIGSTIYAEKLPVLATILISFFALLIIIFFLPDIKPGEFKKGIEREGINKILGLERKDCFKEGGTEKLSLKKVLHLPGIKFLLILNFLIFLGFNFFYTAFPYHALHKLNWSISEMGVFFSVLSLMMVVVEGPVLIFLSKKFSERFLFISGNFILGSNFLLLMSSNTILVYAAAGLFSLGNGLMWPSFLSILSKTATEKYQGSVQGFASSAGSAASIFGLIIGGVIYTTLGTVTFLIAAIVIFSVFLLSFRLKPMNPGK